MLLVVSLDNKLLKPPKEVMPILEAVCEAELIDSLFNLRVVTNVVDIVWLTSVMLYIPETGDKVFPDITINDIGSHILYPLTVPGIVTVKSPLN